MASKIYDEIMAEANNKLRIKKFLDLGLNPRYGLSSEMTMLMVDLYVAASGDTSMSGRYNCGGCLDTMYRKMNDFMAYNDNLGRPLIDWPIETIKENKIVEDDDTSEDEL